MVNIDYDNPNAEFDVVQNVPHQVVQNAPPQYPKLSKEVIENRYEQLKAEQPKIRAARPYNMLNAMLYAASLGGLVWGNFTTGDWGTDIAIFAVSFLTGAVVLDFTGRAYDNYKQSEVYVENLKTLSAWAKPIYVLADTPNDETVVSRANQIWEILTDEKCTNEIHKNLLDSQHEIKYKYNFGFNSGREYDTNGLPVVGLHPKYFLLRGIVDEIDWFNYQVEVLKIAEQVDNQFARIWSANDFKSYQTVVAKQYIDSSEII